jgi:hypothetical protein
LEYKTDSLSSQQLNKISLKDSILKGAPFDRFNSLFNFKVYSFFHLKYVLIDKIDKIDYKGQIYNISVNNDATYITNVCVVHNCECVLLQEDEGKEITPKEKKETLYNDATEKMSDVFKMNAGKDHYVFSPEHPYFQVEPKDRDFGKNNFGLSIPDSD